MSETTSARLLIGADPDDFDRGCVPFVAGAMDETMWEIISEEDEQRIWQQAKETYTPDWQGYEWRVIQVELPAEALRAAIAPVKIKGKVDPA